MTSTEFAEKLKEFGSTVVISPLTEAEVGNIESILDRRLPEYYREFLMCVGLKQDVVWGLNDSVTDFDPLHDFLPDGLSMIYFRFGRNGGEDYWLLKNDDPDDRTIYEYEYFDDGEIKSLGKTFDDLLDESLRLLTENKDKLVANSKKIWAVQFSIETDSVDPIIESLREDFDCKLSKDFGKTRVSPAGVICAEGSITLLSVEIPIKKQEFNGWETASYYFDWEETVAEMNAGSVIKRIESRLKKAKLKVTLIDYGIRNL